MLLIMLGVTIALSLLRFLLIFVSNFLCPIATRFSSCLIQLHCHDLFSFFNFFQWYDICFPCRRILPNHLEDSLYMLKMLNCKTFFFSENLHGLELFEVNSKSLNKLKCKNLKLYCKIFSKQYNIHVWKIIYSIWRKSNLENYRFYFMISKLIWHTPKLCRYEYKINHFWKKQSVRQLWFGFSLMQFSKAFQCVHESYDGLV